MSVLEFTALVASIATLAGYLGALTGLGGGVVVTPALVLLLHVDLRYAIGATIVSVIATSSGAAAAYVREGFSNIRIGMFLEMATTLGAVAGAALTTRIPTSVLSVIFGVVLLYSAWVASQPKIEAAGSGEPDRLATRLKMNGAFPDGPALRRYYVRRVPAGFGLMGMAGVISGLLGIGSGALKVLAMDQVMRIPFKASTATSNFMIGVTAAASAGFYWNRGYIEPGLAMPVMLGVLVGSLTGARHMPGASVRVLRIVFGVVVGVLAIEMIYHGLTGRI